MQCIIIVLLNPFLSLESRMKAVRTLSKDSIVLESKAGRGDIISYGETLLETGHAIKFNTRKVSFRGTKSVDRNSHMKMKMKMKTLQTNSLMTSDEKQAQVSHF